jgi:hypothetical protein
MSGDDWMVLQEEETVPATQGEDTIHKRHGRGSHNGGMGSRMPAGSRVECLHEVTMMTAGENSSCQAGMNGPRSSGSFIISPKLPLQL